MIVISTSPFCENTFKFVGFYSLFLIILFILSLINTHDAD